ncbi:hypothetical protein [Candidatus Avelusimicrobium fimicolum]|uniref:hypothetical protein n=1 Tax=Candidatus Avelusimicrobium fimicolum TaxID=3416216 RepID=UPI003D0B5E16
MKKLITFLFAFLFILAPVWGQRGKTPDLDKRLQISIRTLTTNKNLEMQKTLRQETDINLLKVISWQEFLRLNEKAKERLLASTRLEAKALELQLKENPNMVLPQIEYKNSVPDYSHAFTHKYIFISENISHDTKSAPQEVINILKAARNARPNAKILLAQEFLSWTGESKDSLLKKPGQNSELYSSYPEVTQAADKLKIDQLALDDIIYMAYEKNIAVKNGKYIVWVTPQDKLPLLKYKGCDALYTRWASAYQFIGISPFGVLERNYQWARRIKAAEPHYDLILVYAGSGHLNNTYSNDLPTLLKCKDFAHIALFPTDPIDQAVEKDYETRFLKGEQYAITNDQQQNQEETRLQEQATRGTTFKQSLDQTKEEETHQSRENWKNKKLPLWFSLTKEEILQANPNYKTPNALKNYIDAHCTYKIILAEPRIEQEQKPEVCPAPKTMPIGPKHKSYI